MCFSFHIFSFLSERNQRHSSTIIWGMMHFIEVSCDRQKAERRPSCSRDSSLLLNINVDVVETTADHEGGSSSGKQAKAGVVSTSSLQAAPKQFKQECRWQTVGWSSGKQTYTPNGTSIWMEAPPSQAWGTYRGFAPPLPRPAPMYVEFVARRLRHSDGLLQMFALLKERGREGAGRGGWLCIICCLPRD